MPQESIRVTVVGDISPGDHYFSIGHGIGTTIRKSGLQFLLKNVEQLFSCSDISIANIEGALSNDSCKCNDPVEGYVFRGHESFAFELKACGINVVNVANNHILQHGMIAWRNTIKALELAGIAIIGCRSTGEFSSEPAFINVKGAKIALLGYSSIPEAYFPGCDVYAIADQASILSDVQLCQKYADFVVVSLHAGMEGCSLPEYELVIKCREIADAGASIVLAHHAHVFHPVENYNGSCIAYGLGDLLFDLLWDDSLVESAIVTINMSINAGIESIDIVPVRICPDLVVRKLNGDQKLAFLDRLQGTQVLLEDKLKYQEHFQCKVKADNVRLEKKKLPFMLKNIHKGNTRRKIQFMIRKMINKVSLGG